jgi:anti-anti-sigma factor
MPQITLQELTVEGCPAVSVSGELNINTAPDLREILIKHLKKNEDVILLDLSELEFMDTSGLATLIEAHLKAERYGGKVGMFGLQPRITEVLAVTSVTKLFHIFSSAEEAIKALKGA